MIMVKPAPDMETVIEILTELRNNQSELKSYDRSVMWNSWGYVYFSDEEDIDNAIMAYENVINEPEVTKGLRKSGLLTLAQIHLSQENYDKAITLTKQWMSEVDKVTAQSWYFLGIAYFSKENYNKALESMETAIGMAEEEGYKP